jgi:hypothetical protein
MISDAQFALRASPPRTTTRRIAPGLKPEGAGENLAAGRCFGTTAALFLTLALSSHPQVFYNAAAKSLSVTGVILRCGPGNLPARESVWSPGRNAGHRQE